MTSQTAPSVGQNIREVVNLVNLEKTYFFGILREVQQTTGCAYKDAQLASKNVLFKLTQTLSYKGEAQSRIKKGELDKLINIEVAQLKSCMSKNFDLSEHDFLSLIDRLKHGDNSIFEKVFLHHFDSCLKFVQKKFSISHDEAHDISMDALMFFRQKLLDDKIKYGNLRFLFTQMACQLYIKKNTKISKQLEASSMDIIDEESFDQSEYEMLERSWQDLGKGCQKLLKKIYYGNMKLIDIAHEEEKSDAAIRKQKQRCVDRIRMLFQKNLSRTQ